MENTLPQTPDPSSAPAGGPQERVPQPLYNPGWIPVGFVCVGLGIITGFAEVFSDSVALSFFNSLVYLGLFLSLWQTSKTLQSYFPVQRLTTYFLIFLILWAVLCCLITPIGLWMEAIDFDSIEIKDEDMAWNFIVGGIIALVFGVLMVISATILEILVGVELQRLAKSNPTTFGFGQSAGLVTFIFAPLAFIVALISLFSEDTTLSFISTLIDCYFDIICFVLLLNFNKLFNNNHSLTSAVGTTSTPDAPKEKTAAERYEERNGKVNAVWPIIRILLLLFFFSGVLIKLIKFIIRLLR
ncbi:hypothetical protein [uncultured Rikenella sp.]|uniref:hypothetical protein n=1 Tax=uncultured Rikenella sp. TaxID=368003 RepID=UPI0026233D75|nr:hypothetical protein [uncultured Rikenella sp.]